MMEDNQIMSSAHASQFNESLLCKSIYIANEFFVAEIKILSDDQVPSLMATPNKSKSHHQIFQGYNPSSSSEFGNGFNNSRHPINQLRHTADPFYKG